MELAAIRDPLLNAFVGKVDVASTCNSSNNSHCCMSLVISWKDTTCGYKVIDKFRKTSVASNGSLQKIMMHDKHCIELEKKVKEESMIKHVTGENWF